MYYLLYCNDFVTYMDKKEIRTSEDPSNRLQFNSRLQAETKAKKLGWVGAEAHSDNEAVVYIYNRDKWITVGRFDPMKEKKLIRKAAYEAGIRDEAERYMTITKAATKGYVATFE